MMMLDKVSGGFDFDFSRGDIIIAIIVIVALVAVLVARGGGPRVTQIDRTVGKDKDGTDA